MLNLGITNLNQPSNCVLFKYLCSQHTLDVFGPDRCMFGSDWPVSKLANADFSKVFQLAQELLDHLPKEDKRKIFGLNAIKFYNLKI